MRRPLLTLALTATVVALLAVACGDTGGGGNAEVEIPQASTSSTTLPASTTLPTTTEPQGMCGDLIPVVTDEGTNCVDPTAPAADGDARRVLVAEDGDLVVYTVGDGLLGFESSLVTDHVVTALHQATNGTIFTREVEEVGESEIRVEIARYEPNGNRSVMDRLVDVYDVAVIDGIEAVIGAVATRDGFGFGGVKAFAIDDSREIADFGLAAEAEFGVTHFTWNDIARVGVASAWSDLSEWIGFVDLDGNEVLLPSPTDDLAYNSPPYVTAATISLDGSTLYWAEGPDWGFDPVTDESGPVAAPWFLRGADLRTGEERLFWPLSDPVLDTAALSVESIEDLDGWILVNRAALRGAAPMPLASLILDLTFEEPELGEFPAVGAATQASG